MINDELILTKLARPRTSRWHLPRHHLDALLNDGLSRRLTTLIAAAGHGKTCTLAHFLAGNKLPYLWIQLDPADSDFATFLHYLALGIRQELGGGDRLQTALAAGTITQQPLPLLLSDLNDCKGSVAIVLDDFHLIDRESPVVQLVAGLLQYVEEHVHLFICSRTPLPFSTARMKVIQEAAELTEDDLRFTRDEVAAYMTQMAGITLKDAQLEQICHLTEGWSAALVLLASGLKRRGSLDDFLNGTLPSDLFTYLADEVFHSLAPDVQAFMEESAILDSCAPATCDAILERKDSAAMLTHLLSTNLLVTQLGPHSFRYHHLLQLFLQERLKLRDAGESFRRLLKRAGDWHIAQEQPEEAVRHYLRGGWIEEAARLVEELAPVWLRTSRLDRLRGLLSHLPTEIKERYPWISLCEARHALNVGNPDLAMGLARLALSSFRERGDDRGLIQAQTIIGEIFALRQQYDAAMEAYGEAAAALRSDYRHEEGLLLKRRAELTLLTKGANQEAETDLRRALALHVELGDLLSEAATSGMLGVVRAYLGDYNSALLMLERAAEIQNSLGEPIHESSANLAWAYSRVSRFNDVIRLAEPMLVSSTRKVQRAHAASMLLEAYTRLGDFTKANAMAQTANALAEELGHRELKATLLSELAMMYRLSGQCQLAISCANEAMQVARLTERANFQVIPIWEAILLHLFHTGNLNSAARLAEKALSRLGHGETQPLERMQLTFALAVAEFRQSRTESRPEAVRILQEGLAECRRRGYEFFVLQEWPLALTLIIYGLAYGVQTDYCLDLLRIMEEKLPQTIVQQGISLVDSEARLIPAAWQALPDDSARETFSHLLSPADRRRIVNLASGPAPLRIHCLGPLAVIVGSESVDVKALKKRKSGLLLALLLSQDSPFPREQVLDRLWPDLDPGAADTSLRVTLHHLRRLLEPHLGGKSRSRYIQAEGGLIWFSRQPEVQVDLDQYREALAQAQETIASGKLRQAATALEHACKLYRGDLAMDDPYSSALEDVRNHLRDRYAEALDWLGEYFWHEAQDPPRAIIAFKQRLALDEAHEPAHQSLMRIYLENNQVSAARQQYATCREALDSQLGVKPSRATESLLQLAISLETETVSTAEQPVQKASRRK